MGTTGIRRALRATRDPRHRASGPHDRRRPWVEVPPRVRDGLARLGGLRTVSRSAPSRRTAGEIARTFRALSDPSRVRLLGALVRTPLCPCLMQRIEPMKNSVLSYHLRVLRSAGLVTTSAASHYRIYEATGRGREAVSLFRRPRPKRRLREARCPPRPTESRPVPLGTR